MSHAEHIKAEKHAPRDVPSLLLLLLLLLVWMWRALKQTIDQQEMKKKTRSKHSTYFPKFNNRRVKSDSVTLSQREWRTYRSALFMDLKCENIITLSQTQDIN